MTEFQEQSGTSGSAGSSSSQSQKLFVGNLPWETEEEQLEALFAKQGRVQEADIVYDDRGRSRGFGFVTMSSEEEAQDAIDELHGREYGGRELRVEIANSDG